MNTPKNKRYCLTADLISDPNLIKGFDEWHIEVWPQIKNNMMGTGIKSMEIFKANDCLFMVIDTDIFFSFKNKIKQNKNEINISEWEKLMQQFETATFFAKSHNRWSIMEKILHLDTRD